MMQRCCHKIKHELCALLWTRCDRYRPFEGGLQPQMLAAPSAPLAQHPLLCTLLSCDRVVFEEYPPVFTDENLGSCKASRAG